MHNAAARKHYTPDGRMQEEQTKVSLGGVPGGSHHKKMGQYLSCFYIQFILWHTTQRDGRRPARARSGRRLRASTLNAEVPRRLGKEGAEDGDPLEVRRVPQPQLAHEGAGVARADPQQDVVYEPAEDLAVRETDLRLPRKQRADVRSKLVSAAVCAS